MIVSLSTKYKITKEGSRSELYDVGCWFDKFSAIVYGPIWRLYRKRLFFGWCKQSVTNSSTIVLRWQKEYFNTER